MFDPNTGILYVATYTSPLQVVRVNTTTMTRIDATSYPAYEHMADAAFPYLINGKLYISVTPFGPPNEPGSLVEINAADMTEGTTLTLPAGRYAPWAFAHNPADNEIFAFATATVYPDRHIYKIDLGTMTITNSISVPTSSPDFRAIQYLSATDELIIYQNHTSNGTVDLSRRNADTLAETFIQVMPTDESWGEGMAIDRAHGFGYVYADTAPAKLVKFDLDTGYRVASLEIPAGYGISSSSEPVLDPINNRLYLGLNNNNVASNDALQVVDLSTFTYGALISTSSTANIVAGVVAEDGVWAYFVSSGAASNRTFRFNTSSLTFTGGVILNAKYQNIVSVVLDNTNDNLYTLTNDTALSRRVIIEQNFPSGRFTPTERFQFALGESLTEGIALDTSTKKLYVGKQTTGDVTKIDTFTWTRDADLDFPGISLMEGLDIDTTNDIGYGTSLGTPAKVVKFRLSNMTSLGELSLPGNEGSAFGLDVTRGSAYVVTSTSPAEIHRVDISHKTEIHGTKITLAAPATNIQQVRMYSHEARGNVRLALYDASLNKVWESGNVANNAAGDWIRVPISSGTPTTLPTLAAGDYWLTFQTDSNGSIASYSLGGASTGLTFSHTYGAYPASLTGASLGTANYAMHLGYGAGFSATQTGGTTAITEGSVTDTYSIVLLNAPSANVTVNLSIGGGVVLSNSSLVFTPLNWNTPQTITLSIPDDAVVASNRVETLTHSIVSTLPEYTLDALDPVSVFVTDASGLPPAGAIVGNTSIGGTTYPNGGLTRLDHGSGIGQWQHDSGVYDPTTQTLLYGGSQASIKLVDANTLMHQKDLLTNPDYNEFDFEAADIDVGAGFAYFATDTNPVKIAKVRTADKHIVSMLTMAAGDNGAAGLAVDSTNNALYLATKANPARITKVALSTFTRVGHVTLPDHINGAGDMNIDSAGQTLYIGSDNTSGKVYKVNTATMSYVGSITVPGITYLSVAPGVASGGYVYFFGLAGTPAAMARIRLSDFTLQGTVTGVGLPDYCNEARLDVTGGFAYCSGWSDFIARFNVNTMSYVGSIAVPTTGNYAFVYDQANNIGYLSTDASLVTVNKIDFDTDTIISSVTYPDFEHGGGYFAQDPDGTDLFYLGNNSDGSIVKMNKDTMLRSGYLDHPFTIQGLVYDNTRNVLYAGVDRSGATPDEIIKIDPATMTVTATLTLAPNQIMRFGALTSDGNSAYFGLYVASTTAFQIQKVNLNTFSLDGAPVSAGANDGNLRHLFYDEDNNRLVLENQRTTVPMGYRYYTFDTNTMTFGVPLHISGTADLLGIDPVNNDAFIGNKTTNQILRYDLATWTLESTMNNAVPAYDSAVAYGYMVGNDFLVGYNRETGSFTKSYVSRIDPATMTTIGTTELRNTEIFMTGGMFDATRGSLYSYLEGSVVAIVKTALGHEGAIWGSKVTLTEASNDIDSLRFYAHNADGNLQVALYDANRNLLWESGSIAMSTDDTWYNLAVSNGTPTSLSGLAAGDYYIVFQSDSYLMTPGYTAGNSGDGLFLPQNYGAFPSSLNLADTNARRYSVALTVNVGMSLTESAGATSIVEGGASDSYDIVLNSQPAADVTINLTNPGGLTLSTNTLTFTAANWNVPQTITVSLADTGTSEGTRNLTLSHTIVSSDPYYFTQTLRDVTVSVQDPVVAPAPAVISPYLGSGGGFTVAPNTLGEYLANESNNGSSTTPEDTAGSGSTPSIPTIDLGTGTPTNPSTPTRPSAPLLPGQEPEISLCELQKQNLLRGTNIAIEDIEESDFRTLVRDFGLVISDEAGATDPMRFVTRSEILRLILQTQCGAFTIPKAKDAPFPDVPKFHKDALYIGVAKIQDIVTGYLSDGTFKPDNNISRAEALKIVLEVLFRKHFPVIRGAAEDVPADIARDAWYHRYMTFATERGILSKEEPFRPNDPATKNDIAHFLLEGVRVLSLDIAR